MSSLRVLPGILEAVGGQTEVLFDGGIRRGSDIVKALALGARAVLVGRAYVYGLGAGGGPGVTRAIEILRADLLRRLERNGEAGTAYRAAIQRTEDECDRALLQRRLDEL